MPIIPATLPVNHPLPLQCFVVYHWVWLVVVPICTYFYTGVFI
jgi:hypothetical protein